MTKAKNQKQVQSLIEETLDKYFYVTLNEASYNQIYKTLAKIVTNQLMETREAFHQKTKAKKLKRVHYLSMEFLMGRSLKNALFNLGLTNQVESVLKQHNISLNEIYMQEPDAGLGNGGLGRLAACFMDALASQNYPAMGHSIRYEYGLFKQKIVDGEQVEMPDAWLPGGDVWLQPRQDKACIVKFGGTLTETFNEDGRLTPVYKDYTEVEAFPHDMLVSGYNSKAVSVLRLWEAKSLNKFDMNMFSQGEYEKAMQQDLEIELISKVLYPSDNHAEGKSLRLKQQYFLVSAAMQNMINSHIDRYKDIKTLPDLVAVQINDTHPALCVPEMMRILMDDYYLNWEDSWDMVTKITSYTNHTVLIEALESWNEDLVARLLPRIYSIITEINKRFVKSLVNNPTTNLDVDTLANMSILSKNRVNMANLAIVAAHKVNGVSKLHTDIIKQKLFQNFYTQTPNKFLAITNGIAHRRWLAQSNPGLARLLQAKIGKGFYTNPTELQKFAQFETDKTVLTSLQKIKLANKKQFAELLYRQQGVEINANTRFDVQVKRIHEYKRQLMAVLKIVYLYKNLQQNPTQEFTPQTFIFGGKAASTYYLAKRIIKLINQLGAQIAKDPVISKKLAVVFVENYNVSMAEALIPATEVSQQISLAGKEASGTGNMKFMINGALTMGTFDGANIEMSEQAGIENMFIFGMRAAEVEKTWKLGYNPYQLYEQNPKIKLVLDALKQGFNGESFEDIVNYLINSNNVSDPYMNLADFDAYLAAHNEMDKLYKDQTAWTKRSLQNIAHAGFFAADRAINEYATNVWNLKPLT